MARNLHVYPKAIIVADTWTFIVKVYEHATRVTSRFTHIVPAAVTAEVPLTLLKVSWDMTVDDSVTDQDVDDALFLDDIQPGPQTATVWSEWQELAEGIISGLTTGYTVGDFFAEWSAQNTNSVRQDARRALVTQRGWVVDVGSVHQHEGDGTTTDE
jgi:hypothetical protein